MHAEHEAVGLVLVVVFGQGEVDFVLDAFAGVYEVVLQRVIFAAALARGGCVLERVAEGVGLFVGRLLEFQSYRSIKVGQGNFEGVESSSGNTEGVPFTGFQKCLVAASLIGGGTNARAVHGKADCLDCTTDADFREVCTSGCHALPQVHLARTEQILAEDKVPDHVENAHLHGSVAALRKTEHTIDNVDMARHKTARMECQLIFFFYGEFSVLVCRGGVAIDEKFDERARNRASGFVVYDSGQRKCRCRSECCRQRNRKYEKDYPFHFILLSHTAILTIDFIR